MDDRYLTLVITDEQLDDYLDYTASDDAPYLADDEIPADLSRMIGGWL